MSQEEADFRPTSKPTRTTFVRPLHIFDFPAFIETCELKPISRQFTHRKNGIFLTFRNTEESVSFSELLRKAHPQVKTDYSEPNAPHPLLIPKSDDPLTTTLPPGLLYFPEFITPEEEAAIVDSLDGGEPWQDQLHRRVQHFGLAFDYNTKHIGDVQRPFPAWADALSLRIAEKLKLALNLNQLTCNEYLAGVGISRHCDTHSAFTSCIPVVSLLNPITFDLTKGIDPNGEAKCSLWIAPRSLLVMTGEVRYGWIHAIARRKVDVDPLGSKVDRRRRISLTFRETSDKECKCEYPDLCDSRVPMLLPDRIPR
jgi:alkylated DNA repair dioxygenase AlkB